MVLKLRNNLTKVEHIFDNLEDKLTSRLFYTFDLTLPQNIDDGEYSYRLMDENGAIKATGIIQIGDYKPNNNTYTAQTHDGYVQYNGTI